MKNSVDADKLCFFATLKKSRDALKEKKWLYFESWTND